MPPEIYHPDGGKRQRENIKIVQTTKGIYIPSARYVFHAYPYATRSPNSPVPLFENLSRRPVFEHPQYRKRMRTQTYCHVARHPKMAVPLCKRRGSGGLLPRFVLPSPSLRVCQKMLPSRVPWYVVALRLCAVVRTMPAANTRRERDRSPRRFRDTWDLQKLGFESVRAMMRCAVYAPSVRFCFGLLSPICREVQQRMAYETVQVNAPP